jgi:hypothetical protein
VFRRDSTLIHGVRPYRFHNILLLAGLCGFKTRELAFFRDEIANFEHYWAIYRSLGLQGRYGCDQWMLKIAFTRHARCILDSRFGRAPVLDVPVVTKSREVYDAVNLDDLPANLLKVSDEISKFSGQPHSDTRPVLRSILGIDTPAVRVFRDVLRDFPIAASYYLQY